MNTPLALSLVSGQDLPEAEIRLLDAGHFTLDETTSEITEMIRGFWCKTSDVCEKKLEMNQQYISISLART